jgi:hypothetical protein
MAEPARESSQHKNIQPQIKPNLRAIEGGGEGDGVPKGQLKAMEGGLYNEGGDEQPVGAKAAPSAESTSPQSEEASRIPKTDLREAEQKGLYNPRGDRGSFFGGLSGARGRFNNLTGKLMRHKLLVGVGIGGIGAMFAGLLVLLFLLASLKLPGFLEHITAYQFARVSNEYAKTVERTSSEELAVQTANNSLYTQLKDKYVSLRNNTWGKLDNYRPGIVAKNLATDNNLAFNYRTTALGRQQLVGITLDNKTYLMQNVKGPWRFVPAVNTLLKIRNDVQFSNQFFPVLSNDLEARNVGTLIRGAVANNLRQQAGISLTGLLISKFQGDDPDKAALELDRQAYADITHEQQAAAIPKTQDLRDAAQQAQQQEQQDVSNPSTLQKILDNGGVDPAVSAILQKAFASSTLQSILGVVSPVVQIGMPVCIIYDGSLSNSGPTIDQQMTEQQRAFYLIASTTDQQKTGETTGEAVGALNAKIGNTGQSNAEIRAVGGQVDTSNTLSGEASAGGQYTTIFDAVGGNGSVASVFNFAAGNLCPYITNTGVIVGITLAQLVAAAASGGLSIGAEDTAQTAAESILGNLADSFFSRFGSSKAGSIGGKAGDIISDTVKTGGKIAGATIAAKLIVMSDIGGLHNGLEQNTDFSNEGDAGGNYTAQQLDQNMQYGIPLTTPQALQSNKQTLHEVAVQAKNQSPFVRYADINNPDSFVTRLGVEASTFLNASLVSRLASLMGSLLAPLQGITHIFSSTIPSVAYAAANPGVDNSDYGNVQFGWTPDEESLIDSSSSYNMLENQSILDASGVEDQIAAKYGKCFTDSIGVLLSGSDNGVTPEIVRDQNGNVIADQGLCSRLNLSYDSPDPLAHDGSFDSPKIDDLVFRWRLANRYGSTTDQLNAMQAANIPST